MVGIGTTVAVAAVEVSTRIGTTEWTVARQPAVVAAMTTTAAVAHQVVGRITTDMDHQGLHRMTDTGCRLAAPRRGSYQFLPFTCVNKNERLQVECLYITTVA